MAPLYQHLKKGRFLLMYIPLLIMVSGICLTIYYVNFIEDFAGIKFAMVLSMGIILSIALGWIWWSYWVVLWKIEGLEKIQDVHLLYRRAISGRLIWPQYHKYEKTEFRFGSRRERLEELEEKLDMPRVEEFIIDESISENYQVPVSRTGLYIGIVMLVTALLCYLLFKNFIPVFCLLVYAFFGFWTYINHRKKGAIFMNLNSERIEVNGKSLAWQEVRDHEVVHEGYGKDQKTYMKLYTSPDSFGIMQIDIARANASRSRIEYLLDVFHHRYLMKNQNQSQ